MKHFASPAFWEAYRKLPQHVRALADKNYSLLQDDPKHPLGTKRLTQSEEFGFL